LLPALVTGRIAGSAAWFVTETVPERSPFEALASALARIATTPRANVAGELAATPDTADTVVAQLVPSGTGVLIVVDQFDELFTNAVESTERRSSLAMIIAVAQRGNGSVRFVLTLRADFFDRPLSYPGFGDAVHGRTVVLGPMIAAELAEAIRQPAGQLGVE